jgi:hypothetical protein
VRDDLLRYGDIELLGRMPWSSNQTYLVTIAGDEPSLSPAPGGGRERRLETGSLAIYKPRNGERPLWDFPPGTLCQREVAAFEVANALGWDLVPLTVLRDGPHGVGMVQRFVDHDPDEHFFTLRETHGDEFRGFALFDVIINNADRKSGHCLRSGEDGHIWGIDHGVSFHRQPKLRTVIWDYEGDPIPDPLLADLTRLADQLDADGAGGGLLGHLLSPPEVNATFRRLAWLLDHGVFPAPVTDYPYPWPMV